MHINPHCKLRQVAGEHIIMLQGAHAGDLTRVIALNPTALYLWDKLKDRDFSLQDVVFLLLDEYQVEEPVARRDADNFLQTLQQNNLLL